MKQDVKKEAINRLKSARGHLDHVISQVENENYCIDILQQSLAVQSALKAVDQLILKGHLEEHVSEAVKGRNKSEAIREVIDIFDKARK